MARTRHIDRTYRLLESWKMYDWWNVEIYNPYSGKKTDFFHIIDTLVLTDNGILAVQTCGPDFSNHKKKLLNDEKINTSRWLATPGTKLLLIGWRKLRMKGTRKRWKWYPRMAWISLNKKGKLCFVELPLEK